jgi:hypothetical protein
MALVRFGNGQSTEIFSQSWDASYDAGNGQGLAASYRINERSGPAHLLAVVQVSQNTASMKDAASTLTTVYKNMARNDDITLVTFNDSYNAVYKRCKKSKVNLRDLLAAIEKDGKGEKLWDAFVYACNLFKSWSKEMSGENCFLVVHASGYDVGSKATLDKAQYQFECVGVLGNHSSAVLACRGLYECIACPVIVDV